MARWLTAVAVAVVVAGCGSEPELSASAADELHRGVDAVRTAAGAGDREGALQALEELRARVERAQLAEADAAALRQGIRRARRRVEQDVVAPQPTAEPGLEATTTPEPELEPQATPEPVPAPPKGEKPKKDKPGKGIGRGRFDDGGDGDGEEEDSD